MIFYKVIKKLSTFWVKKIQYDNNCHNRWQYPVIIYKSYCSSFYFAFSIVIILKATDGAYIVNFASLIIIEALSLSKLSFTH